MDHQHIKEGQGELVTTGKQKTELLYGVKDAVGRGITFMRNVRNRMDISFDHRAPSIVIELESYKAGYINIRKRGGKIRALTEITSDNIHYCKEIMKIVNEFRHLDGLKGGIAVSETEYMATTILQEAKPLTQVIYSNVKEMVEQGQSIFDTLWNKSITAKQRIKEIEQGTKREFINTIHDPAEIKKVALGLLNSATHEILIMFSVAKGIRGSQEYTEVIQLLKEASKHNIIIRILSDSDDPINDIIEKLNKELGGKEKIKIRHHNKPRETKLTIMIVDDLYSLTVEMKDSAPTNFDEAIGLATYSNSESTVSSYVTIFETLWMQTELYEKASK